MKKLWISLLLAAAAVLAGSAANAQKPSGPAGKGKELIIPVSLPSNDTMNVITVKREVFAKTEKLACSEPGYEVTSFVLTLYLGGDVVSFKCRGNELSPEARKVLIKNAPGMKAWIENIEVIYGDGKAKKLPPVAIKM